MKKLAVIALALLAVGCAKDKSLDDYQKDQLQKNQALYHQVGGNYTGLVVSKTDGSVLGALQVYLTDDTQPNDPKEGEPSIGSPILNTSMNFLDASLATFSTSKSYYDPDTGSYTTQFTVSTSGGNQAGSNAGGTGSATSNGGRPATETVVLRGTLSPGVLDGDLSTLSYPQFGGTVHLVRNGENIKDLINQERAKHPRQAERTFREFIGTAKMPNSSMSYGSRTYRRGHDQPRSPELSKINLSVNKDHQSSIQDFLDIFAPYAEQTLTATINFPADTSINFVDSTWDQQTGMLEGSASLGTTNNNVTAYLRCQNFFFVNTQGNFSCQYWSSRSPVINISFKPPYDGN